MARARTGPWTAAPPQDGRRFVVTGATSGIGLETARRLVDAGAHVVLAVRNLERGERVAAGLRASLLGSVQVRRLDVSDLSSVREFAAGVGEVDVLVNHAGVLGLPFARSVDGFEMQLATNHLGHFALANLLLPRLADRVVVVASQSHRSGGLDLTDLDWTRRGYRPYAAYATSKQANLLFLGELQRRLTAAGAHPATPRPRSSPAPATPPSHGSPGSATRCWACRPGGARSRRCTPPRWTCRAIPTSARTGSASSTAGRCRSDGPATPATPTSPGRCGRSRSR